MNTYLNSKKKVLLIYPPNDLGMGESTFRPVLDIYQPLGLAYIAAVLEKSGYDVVIIDAKVESLSLDDILRRIARFHPDLIGITATTADFSISRQLARHIKSRGNYPILIGGPHVSALPEETMRDENFDYGIIGEGEQTTLELAHALVSQNTYDVQNIKGIMFRENGKIVHTPPRECIPQLDDLPFPARHLLPPPEKYSYLYYKHLPVATMITSRGCPYQCIFCDHSVFGFNVRMRSVSNLIEELEMLVKRYGVREVIILDDLFTLYRDRTMEFCQRLLEKDIDIAWSCMSRVDTVTYEMLKLMKRAGCWRINYGIESGNQEVLHTIKKNITLDAVTQAVRWTHALGIRSLGFFILGFPGETRETIEDTIRFARTLPLDRVVFFIAQPLPGTELYHLASRQGRLQKDVDYRYYHLYCFPEKIPYVSEGLSIELLKRCRTKAYRDFYFRPHYLLRQLLRYREFKGLPSRMRALFKAIT